MMHIISGNNVKIRKEHTCKFCNRAFPNNSIMRFYRTYDDISKFNSHYCCTSCVDYINQLSNEGKEKLNTGDLKETIIAYEQYLKDYKTIKLINVVLIDFSKVVDNNIKYLKDYVFKYLQEKISNTEIVYKHTYNFSYGKYVEKYINTISNSTLDRLAFNINKIYWEDDKIMGNISILKTPIGTELMKLINEDKIYFFPYL